jgi:hypothetical protein
MLVERSTTSQGGHHKNVPFAGTSVFFAYKIKGGRH